MLARVEASTDEQDNWRKPNAACQLPALKFIASRMRCGVL
jgi:hypothetical protein